MANSNTLRSCGTAANLEIRGLKWTTLKARNIIAMCDLLFIGLSKGDLEVCLMCDYLFIGS